MASALASSSALLSSKSVQRSAFNGKPVRAPVVRAAKKVSTTVMAADRPVWYPGNPPPSYLDGSLAGDYGFDPLGLGSDPELLKWFVQAELVHGRTAMTAVAGILIPGLLTKAGALNVPEWYEAGKVYIENNEVSIPALLFAQFALSGWAETKRWEDFKNPGSQADGSFFGVTDGFKGKENGYPGGLFDPFGFSNGSSYAEYKTKEIKNGRLAMLAFVGFVFQYYATGKGPVENLFDHLADPYHVTFATNGTSLPFLS